MQGRKRRIVGDNGGTIIIELVVEFLEMAYRSTTVADGRQIANWKK